MQLITSYVKQNGEIVHPFVNLVVVREGCGRLISRRFLEKDEKMIERGNKG
jgi:hypothetical protein